MTALPFSGVVKAQDAPDGAQLFQACAACHQIGKGRLIGPDLMKVTERRDRDWIKRFILNSQEVIQSGDETAVKLFEEYNKVPMPPFQYSDAELEALIVYIENYDPTKAVVTPAPVTEEGPGTFFVETETHAKRFGTTFIISLILALAAAFDLLVTKFVKARFVHLIVILISLAIMTEITIVEAQNLGRQQGYEPDQPILFSHKIHAGDNKIDCRFCHATVTESKHAGIPPVSLCLNCHYVVRQGRYSGTAEIDKIFQAVESGRPIEWIRVHNLPDHTYFNHAQHVGAGKVDCMMCHGDVAKMDRIRQEQPLSMGWCIQCHRQMEVQFIDNEFYKKYGKLHEEIAAGKRSKVTVDDVGGTECAKCHY